MSVAPDAAHPDAERRPNLRAADCFWLARCEGYNVVSSDGHLGTVFGVRFDPAGTVSRVEVMVYREAYGGEVRSERFLKQFIGKKAADPILAGKVSCGSTSRNNSPGDIGRLAGAT